MLLSASDKGPDLTQRISELKKAVQEYQPGICTERALIWTRYFKKSENRKKPVCIQIAEAFREVLAGKTVKIYPESLLSAILHQKESAGGYSLNFSECWSLRIFLNFRGEKQVPFRYPVGKHGSSCELFLSGCSGF